MKTMDEITIPETTISTEQYVYNARQLAMAITLQAAREYCSACDTRKDSILKELRSTWMDIITDGTSVIVAEQLELHPEEIRARLRKTPEEE